jgi:NTE family protein
MEKKVALVLSGGGAKGAFQVGAELYAREIKGYEWSVISGVSVGALNGAMLAMRKYDRMKTLWAEMSPEKIFGPSRGALHVLRSIVTRKPGIFSNDWIADVLASEVDPSRMTVDLRIGAVSLVTGEYHVFRPGDPRFMNALLASAALPPIFPPVEVADDLPAMVDGGVKNVSPVGDVLDAHPDEIVVINCNPMTPSVLKAPPRTALRVTQRAFEISMDEIFKSDIAKVQRMNRLVEQADAVGLILRKTDGRPYRKCPLTVIAPDERTGDTTDFTRRHIEKAMEAGWEKARNVLG